MQEKSHRVGSGSAGSDLQTFLCKDEMIIRTKVLSTGVTQHPFLLTSHMLTH